MLEIKRFELSGEKLCNVIFGFNNSHPRWFIQGFLDVDCINNPGQEVVCSMNDRMQFTTYSEGSIFDHYPWLSDYEVPVTEEQKERAYAQAACNACQVVVVRDNYRSVGDVFLNKHPECRRNASDDEAIFEAALAERQAVFTSEMYD